MRNFKTHWLLASVSLLAVASCAPKTVTSYSVCDDVNITNNDCPDVTSNVVVLDDINGMK